MKLRRAQLQRCAVIVQLSQAELIESVKSVVVLAED